MKTIRRFRSLQLLLWLGLLALLALALRRAPLKEVWQTLSGLGGDQIAILILLNLGIVFLLSSRWWLILRSLGHPLPYIAIAGYRLAAFGVSYFTPGPQFGGEPLQVHFTRQRHAVPLTASVTAVTLDKLFELLGNFSFLAFGVLIATQGRFFDQNLRAGALPIAIGLLALPALYLLALGFGQKPLSGLIRRAPSRYSHSTRLKQAREAVVSAEGQAVSFCRERPLAFLGAMLLTLLIWGALIAEYWLALHFLGAQLTLPQTIGALTLARLAFLSPTPGGLGALEASQVFAMGAMGLSPALGLSLSFLIRARDVFFGGSGLLLGMLLTRGKPAQTMLPEVGD